MISRNASSQSSSFNGMTSRYLKANSNALKKNREELLTTSREKINKSIRNENCLIANTKSGGHAFLGYHLTEKLLERNHTVTILNDGDPKKLMSKNPFKQYTALEKKGVNIIWKDPKNASDYPTDRFDVVYDNNGKKLEVCQPLIDFYKGKVSHYVFVGSAGAYKASNIEPGHFEGDARKATAGHVEVENYLDSQNVPYTVFQPLYMYGPYTAKDCEQWFIDRVIRDRPVPIPYPGIQCTSISHVEDVASMLASVPGNPNAIKQHYNTSSDRTITFEGIARIIAKALNKRVTIVLYDPRMIGLKKGEGFPFRSVHFFASVDKAKMDLGWKPLHTFSSDVLQLIQDYTDSGRHEKEIDFSIDDKILSHVSF